jgi:hypothetical protein
VVITTDDRRQEHPMLCEASTAAQRLTPRGAAAMLGAGQPSLLTSNEGSRKRWRR